MGAVIFLNEILFKEPDIKDKLILIIKASKIDVKLMKAASNSISLLAYCNIPLSGYDFSHC